MTVNNPDISHVPAQEWEAMLTPESIGWSGTWLHQVQDYTQEICPCLTAPMPPMGLAVSTCW